MQYPDSQTRALNRGGSGALSHAHRDTGQQTATTNRGGSGGLGPPG